MSLDRPLDPIRVLFVDDQPGFLETATEMLEEASDDLEIVQATSTEEGLDRLAEHQIDCILADYQMDERDGVEFLQTVRNEYGELPFIVYTGEGSEQVAAEAISSGVTDYILKQLAPEHYTLVVNRIKNAVESHRAKLAFQASVRNLRQIHDRITDGFFSVDTEWQYTYVNDKGAQLVNRDPEELIGQTVWEAFPDLLETPFEEALRTAMESKQTTTIEDYYPPQDAWYDMRVYGDNTGLSIYFRDVTERKEREQELEHQKAFLEQVRDFVTVLDSNGTVRFQSEATEDVIGHDPEDVVGENIKEFVHPKDRDELSSLFTSLSSRPEDQASVELRMRTKEAGWCWIEARGVNRLDDPMIEGYILSSRDITERKEREQALRDERNFFEQAINSIPDLFYVIQPDGSMLRWNDEIVEVTGYTDEEISEIDALEFFPEDERERAARAIEQTLSTGQYDAEIDLLTADGDRIPYEFSGSRLTDSEGDLVGLVGIGRDLTTQKERENRLQRQAEIIERERDLKDEMQEVLISLSSREEIEESFCETIVAEGYRFASICEQISTDSVAIRSFAGDFENQEFPNEVIQGQEAPIQTVLDTGQHTKINDVHEIDAAWAQAAQAHDIGTLIAFPLVHDTLTYGVLIVGARDPGAFGRDEERLFEDLSETIAYAIHRFTEQDALRSEQPLQVELDVEVEGSYLSSLVDNDRMPEDFEISVIDLGSDSDGRYRQYLKVDDADPAVVEEIIESSEETLSIEHLTGESESDSPKFEVKVSSPTFIDSVVELGGAVRDATLTPEGLSITVDFAPAADLTEILSSLRDRFDEVTLVSKTRTQNEDEVTETRILSELTNRQIEVLKVAYFNGFFDRPQEKTADELSSELDISRSTFLHHLRAAETRIIDELVA